MTIAVLGLGYEIFSYSVIKRSFLTSTLAEEIPETKANLRSQALVFFSTFEYCTLTVFIIANFHRKITKIVIYVLQQNSGDGRLKTSQF